MLFLSALVFSFSVKLSNVVCVVRIYVRVADLVQVVNVILSSVWCLEIKKLENLKLADCSLCSYKKTYGGSETLTVF